MGLVLEPRRIARGAWRRALKAAEAVPVAWWWKKKILPSVVAGLNVFLARRRPTRKRGEREAQEVSEVRARVAAGTDISDHLVELFAEALLARPRLIVELGVRGGESTFVLERVARLSGAALVSVDIDDCRNASKNPAWHFVQADDIEFAGRFHAWAESRSLPREVDLLFVDSSHLFEHSEQEIAAWFPLLSPRAKVIFHDTNMSVFYRRRDGALDIAWNNQRGVIRALENFLSASFDESKDFTEIEKGWFVRHRHHSLGLTILQRLPLREMVGRYEAGGA